MPLKLSSPLSTILNSSAHQVAWGANLVSTFGSGARFICRRDGASGSDPWTTGTEFLNIGMPTITSSASTGVISFGALTGKTTQIAADLSTGKSVFRIVSGTYYIEGTLGLAGSGSDLIMSVSPISNSGFIITGATILPPSSLPLDGFVVPIGGTVTNVSFENTSTSAATNQPVTFGQAFAKGAMTGSTAAVQLVGPTTVPAQMDVRATHSDGSVRHAVISAVIPSLAASTTTPYNLVSVTKPTPTPAVPSDFPGLDSVVSIVEGGVTYTASLASLLATPANYTTSLSGNICTRWVVKAPLVSSGSVTHPRIHARFYVTAYKGSTNAQIRVALENTWVIPNPAATAGQSVWINNSIGDVTYDVAIKLGGTSVFTQSALKHFPYTRWTKTFQWGAAQVINPKQNVAYLIASKAVPNYDTSITVNSAAIASAKSTYLANNAPLHSGVAEQYMPNTGGRDDLAILPGWDVRYLLSMDKDARIVSLGQGDLAGSWAAYFRNKTTDLPVTVADYPYASLVGNHGDCFNPGTGKYEDFPATVSNTNTNTMQTAHCPDLSFIPYLLTGDDYYLEGLQFFAHYTTIWSNPGLRSAGLGLFNTDETRGQGWAFRTVAHAWYITPDSHPHKSNFNTILQNNTTWYDTNYTNSGTPQSVLGIMDSHAIVYPDSASDASTGETLGIAPWQDDYFTQAVARAVELGYTNATNLLNYKIKFAIARLTSGSAFCYVYASKFALNIKAPSAAGNAYYTTMNQVYLNTIPSAARAPACGSQAMCDYLNPSYAGRTMVPGQLITDGSGQYDGYANLMGPAVAAAATYGGTAGANAWMVYSNSPRAPDTSSHPQFAILPRT